jgi:signal transduction histidine kinase
LPLLGFVTPADRPMLLDFLRRCRQAHRPEVEAELAVSTTDGERVLQLLARPKRRPAGEADYFVALVDVTDRKSLDRERARVAREHAALASRLISAQDEERQRIARNLHDDIGQLVTALRLLVLELAEAAPSRAAGDHVTRLQQLLEQLDRRLHFVASELRPAVLDLGITAAIEQFVREWSDTFGIAAAFQPVGLAEGWLSPETETHLYRIMQEALNNVAKHAAAHHVTVLLERRGEGVVLVVEDDGRGFDVDSTRGLTGRLGVIGMRERAQIMGGRLEIESTPGQGTSVYVSIPQPRDARPVIDRP